MEIIYNLVPRIANLYALIFLGYLSVKYVKIDRNTLAYLSIYFFIPFVMFYGVINAGYSAKVIFLPFFALFFSCVSCFIVFKLSHKFLPEKTQANILALVAGTGNSGYFGIPIALMLFDEKGVGIYITLVLGMTIFQNTVGFYITSLGSYSAKESFYKVIKLPVIYAFFAGCIFNIFHLKMPESTNDFFTNIRGAYIVIGMMIIGAGLASIEKFKVNFKFTTLAIIARNVIWPLVALCAILIDNLFFGIFDKEIKNAILLASIVPIAADSVAIASILKCHPEEMASTVLISSLISIIYIPIILSIFY
jgi:predicted permease